MNTRSKDILPAVIYAFAVHLLYWLCSYMITENSGPLVEICFLTYIVAIFPCYFIARGFSKKKWVFWSVSLGLHTLISALSRWTVEALIQARYITGWDDWNYLITWLFVVLILGAALLLDLMILAVRALLNRRKKAPITECAEDSDENEK